MNDIPRPFLVNVADLLEHLAVPPERVRLAPPPGQATEDDALKNRLCELMDGVLVEKPMGYYESRLAVALLYFLERYLDGNACGFLLDSSGLIRVNPEQLRLPDVSYVSWEHFPNRKLPRSPVLGIVPDLPVEILSTSNTQEEMARKRREYFAGGAKQVWEVDPESRTVEVFTSATDSTTLDESMTLEGGSLLPGFALPIHAWFARAGERED